MELPFQANILTNNELYNISEIKKWPIYSDGDKQNFPQ